CGVPITIRCIIGKGWGQGAQHSQSLQALFAHIPGLKVVMPSTPYDAKGLLIASIEDKNPVIFIEHRRLYDYRESVPQGIYRIPLGKGRIIKVGKDVTIVASSLMVQEAIKSAAILKKDYKIDAEILDLRCLKPLDKKLILNSVRKTKRLIVADNGWKEYGVSAEISALVAEFCYPSLKAPIKRIALPTAATPTSVYLENLYYPNVANIVKVTRDLINGRNTPLKPIRTYRDDSQFKGPF
ncbi:MAG: alpha-ketoacid dehydrogenase subunit beta, partial [Candidatus Omnitrophica bacterium]|nr:alpha-ketoacid dehydrogenase subunit beta [Candidatus Omnitrophota bacterium]